MKWPMKLEKIDFGKYTDQKEKFNSNDFKTEESIQFIKDIMKSCPYEDLKIIFNNSMKNRMSPFIGKVFGEY